MVPNSMRRDAEEIKRLVKTAVKWNLDSDEGYEKFRLLAHEHGFRGDRLCFYLNAYQAAGESGLKALTYKKPMPEEVRIEAGRRINEFLAGRLPKVQDPENKIRFQVTAKGNRITGAEKRPLFGDPAQASCVDCFQVRYTGFDRRWHLYWKRASGRWWPYVPDRPVYTVEDCLREIASDASGCFWG